jgi:flagellar protein FliJ
MKRFTFRLERLLQLREAAEKDQARQLGDALREEARRREAVAQSHERLAEARRQFAETPGEMTRAGTLRNLELAINALAGQARSMEATHEQSLERVEAERHQYEQARVARRVLERLREHRKEAWGVEMSRKEQSVTDEAASRRTSGGQEGM